MVTYQISLDIVTSLKRNFGWNMLLTVSGYVFPLLTFPYVTRVLGADKLGLANFAMSLVDYAVLFSTLGLGYIGAREVSQNLDNQSKLDDVFSKLVSLHFILSLLILLIYLPCILIIPEFSSHKQLYLVGVVKILSNILLVEWFFGGLQKFKFVTIRSLLVKVIFVFGIFIFVRTPDDYDAFFYLSIGQVALNGIINWWFANKFVSFSFKLRKCGEYISSVLTMGVNILLFSFYGSFNVLYLGIKCNTEAVGYYTTSIKLYNILLAIISAYNGVLGPYLNNIYGKGDIVKYKQMLEKSIPIVFIFTVPTIILGFIYAHEIILLIAGEGYERSVYPFQIILVQLLLVGIAQILENQILLTFKKHKEILISTIISVSIAVAIMILFVSQYGEVASAYSVAIPHVVEIALLYYFAKRCINFDFSFTTFLKVVLSCIPIVLICIFVQYFISNGTISLVVGCLLSALFYFFIHYYIIKNEFVLSTVEHFRQKFI